MVHYLSKSIKDVDWSPLPYNVRISNEVEYGTGIVSQSPIFTGSAIGVSHVVLRPKFSISTGIKLLMHRMISPDGWMIRTPLGGFINHSEDPNCARVKAYTKNYDVYILKSIKDITQGEELTLKYEDYTPSGVNYIDEWRYETMTQASLQTILDKVETDND